MHSNSRNYTKYTDTTFEFDKSSCNIPKNIKLADPQFNLVGEIDILIGAERFWELICVGKIKLGNNQPVLQKSSLGWLVSGTIGIFAREKIQTSCNLSLRDDLNEAIHKFWEIENYTSVKSTSDEDEYCEAFFKKNYSRQSDGRFIVRLPIKEEVLKSLDDSKKMAQKRLYALERKFMNKPDLKIEYIKFMKEYLALGHMKQVSKILDDKIRVFIPHQAVIKESSATTKTKVVFDASSKDSKRKSLNDALYKGPVLQAEIFSIIIRFRCFKYVLCADIKKCIGKS